MKTIAERLREVINEKEITAYRLGKDNNKTSAKYDKILNGTNQPTSETLQEIKHVIPDLNLNYLITGQGERYLDFKGTGGLAGLQFLEVPFVPVKGYASFLEAHANHIHTADTYPVLKSDATFMKNPHVFQIEGTAMKPTLPPHSRVLCEEIEKDEWIYITGGLYIILTRNAILARRVIDNDLMLKGYLMLHSDHPQGGTLPIAEKDIKAIWKMNLILNAAL